MKKEVEEGNYSLLVQQRTLEHQIEEIEQNLSCLKGDRLEIQNDMQKVIENMMPGEKPMDIINVRNANLRKDKKIREVYTHDWDKGNNYLEKIDQFGWEYIENVILLEKDIDMHDLYDSAGFEIKFKGGVRAQVIHLGFRNEKSTDPKVIHSLVQELIRKTRLKIGGPQYLIIFNDQAIHKICKDLKNEMPQKYQDVFFECGDSHHLLNFNKRTQMIFHDAGLEAMYMKAGFSEPQSKKIKQQKGHWEVEYETAKNSMMAMRLHFLNGFKMFLQSSDSDDFYKDLKINMEDQTISRTSQFNSSRNNDVSSKMKLESCKDNLLLKIDDHISAFQSSEKKSEFSPEIFQERSDAETKLGKIFPPVFENNLRSKPNVVPSLQNLLQNRGEVTYEYVDDTMRLMAIDHFITEGNFSHVDNVKFCGKYNSLSDAKGNPNPPVTCQIINELEEDLFSEVLPSQVYQMTDILHRDEHFLGYMIYSKDKCSYVSLYIGRREGCDIWKFDSSNKFKIPYPLNSEGGMQSSLMGNVVIGV